jgi:hypothetical protein
MTVQMPRAGDLPKFELNSAFCARDSWVIGANMGWKLFVALQLDVPHHFIKGIAGGRARRVEQPSAFGATVTPKTASVDPYKLARHSPTKVGL